MPNQTGSLTYTKDGTTTGSTIYAGYDHAIITVPGIQFTFSGSAMVNPAISIARTSSPATSTYYVAYRSAGTLTLSSSGALGTIVSQSSSGNVVTATVNIVLKNISGFQMVSGTNTFTITIYDSVSSITRTISINATAHTHVSPSITSYEVRRCTSSGTADNLGGYFQVRASWTYDTVLFTSSQVNGSFSYTLSGGSSGSNVALTAGTWSTPRPGANYNTQVAVTFYVEDPTGGVMGSDTRTYTLQPLTYEYPQITSASAQRVNSSGQSTKFGGYIRIQATWTIASVGGDNTASGTFTWKVSGGTDSSDISLPGSGSWSSVFGGGTVTPGGYYTAAIKVTDRLGNTATYNLTVSPVQVVQPAITSVSAVRCLSDGTENGIGTYLKTGAGWSYDTDLGNVITASFVWRISGGTDSGSVPIPGISAWSSAVGDGSIGLLSSYVITVTITDILGNTASSQYTLQARSIYFNPYIASLEAMRCDSSGNPDNTGGYLKVRGTLAYDAVDGHNSAAATFVWRPSTQGPWNTPAIALPDNNAWSAPFGAGAINIIAMYYVQASVEDAVGNSGSRQMPVYSVGYDPPEITGFEAIRCDSSGNEDVGGSYLSVRASWTYTSLGGANVATGSFTWAQDGMLMSAPIALTNGAWSAPVGDGEIDRFLNYLVILSVVDIMDFPVVRTILLSAGSLSGDYWGFVSTARSTGLDNSFEGNAPVMSVVFTQPSDVNGIYFEFNIFDDSYCTSMEIQYLDALWDVIETGIVSPDSVRYNHTAVVYGVSRINIAFYQMNKGDRFLWLQKLVFGSVHTYADDELSEHSALSEEKLAGEDLPIGALSFSLLSKKIDPAVFAKRKQIKSKFDNVLQGTYFVDDADRAFENSWSFRCLDVVDILERTKYHGNIYDNDLLVEHPYQSSFFWTHIIQGIQQLTGVNIRLDESLAGARVTGWLPICTCRYALVQAAFAIGAVIDVQNDGTIYLRKISDTVTSHFDNSRCMMGVQVKRDKIAIKDVELSAWSFIEKQLIDGGTVSPAIETISPFTVNEELKRIEFSEPRKYLQAVHVGGAPPSGQFVNMITQTSNHFEYMTSAFLDDNWELRGATVVKSEKIFTKENTDIHPNEAATGIRYNQYTLINVDNAQQILDIAYDMAMRNEVVSARVILDGEKVGDMVTIDTDQGMKTGIITKLNTSLGNRMIADMEVRC